MGHSLRHGGLLWLRENIFNRESRKLLGVGALLFLFTRGGFLILKKRVIVIGFSVIRFGAIEDRFELARTNFEKLVDVVRRGLSFGLSVVKRRSFRNDSTSLLLCPRSNPPVRLTPRCEFDERCKPAAGNRKIVKNICNVPRVELKLPRGKGVTETVVQFGSLALREKVLEFKIAGAVLVFFSPLVNGLKTTVGVSLQIVFLLFTFQMFGAFGEYLGFAMGQGHGDGLQSTAQFLNLVRGQGCFSAHPLSALLVEINRGAVLRGFILEDRQRFERRPRTGQDGFHLGLLPWRGEPSKVGLDQFHDSAQEALTVYVALSVATSLYCKPEHHPKELVSVSACETPFGHFQGSGCKALV